MAQPITTTYLNVQTARAAAALPAAGAWDAAPTALQCSDFGYMTLYISYTRGGVGGAADFRVQVSNDLAGTDWFTLTASNQAALVAGTDTQIEYQRDYWTYTATGAGAETTVLGPFALNGTVERVRIACRESGNVGAPGAVTIEARFAP